MSRNKPSALGTRTLSTAVPSQTLCLTPSTQSVVPLRTRDPLERGLVVPGTSGDSDTEPLVPRDPFEPLRAEVWANLERRYPHPARIVVAMALARDPEACQALLRGEPVDPARLDERALLAASARRLVRLDLTELDLLEVATGAGT